MIMATLKQVYWTQQIPAGNGDTSFVSLAPGMLRQGTRGSQVPDRFKNIQYI